MPFHGMIPLALAAGAAAGPPQVPCAPHALVAAQLAERHGERPVALGVTAAGWMMQLYAGPPGGTWTIVLTRPDGLSCLADHGTGFERAPPPDGPGA